MHAKRIQSQSCQMINIQLNRFFQINTQHFMCPERMSEWRCIIHSKKRSFFFILCVPQHPFFVYMQQIGLSSRLCMVFYGRESQDCDKKKKRRYSHSLEKLNTVKYIS